MSNRNSVLLSFEILPIVLESEKAATALYKYQRWRKRKDRISNLKMAAKVIINLPGDIQLHSLNVALHTKKLAEPKTKHYELHIHCPVTIELKENFITAYIFERK